MIWVPILDISALPSMAYGIRPATVRQCSDGLQDRRRYTWFINFSWWSWNCLPPFFPVIDHHFHIFPSISPMKMAIVEGILARASSCRNMPVNSCVADKEQVAGAKRKSHEESADISRFPHRIPWNLHKIMKITGSSYSDYWIRWRT